MDDSFIKTRNITYDRFVFFCSKQQKEESVESFCGQLNESADNCSSGDEKTALIQDGDIQRELLKETVSPTKALEVAIHIEIGARNQKKINQNLKTNTQLVNFVNNFQGYNGNENYQQSCKDFTRYPTVPQNFQYNSICANGTRRWSPNHRQICPANGKKCNNCEITGHFAKKCCQPKNSQSQTPKPPQTNVNQIDANTTKSKDEESVKYKTSYQQLYDQV